MKFARLFSVGTQSAFFLALGAGLVAGCATSARVERIDAKRELYGRWPIEIRQAVLDGKIEVGMDEEMVTMALGEPQETATRPSSPGSPEEMIWTYRPLRDPDFGPNPREYPGRSPDPRPVVDQDVVFRDGVVLRVDRNRIN